MITLKPGSAYAPNSIGMDYQKFLDLESKLPVTGDTQTDVEMTGGGSLQLAAFRFGGTGTTFLADRNNVIGLVIEAPAGGSGSSGELQFRIEKVVNGYSGTIGVIGTADTSVAVVKVKSLVWDDTSGIRPEGAKFHVLIFDTAWHALNDPLEPIGTYPITVPLIDPTAQYSNNLEVEPLQIGLSSDVEPANGVDNPTLRVTIIFEYM